MRELGRKNSFKIIVVDERNDLLNEPIKSIPKGSILIIEASILRVSELNELIIYSNVEIKKTESM